MAAADYRYPDARLILFARAPVPGACKTRLIPALGADGAAQLHTQLVVFMLEQLVRSKLAPVELWCAPDDGHALFLALAERLPVVLCVQRGDDLGERMHNALACGGPALLVGSDAPALDLAELESAMQSLHADTQAVIVPAEDGGYAMVSVQRSDMALFHGVAWGSANVMAQSRANLRALGWRWRELSTVWDLDRPEDLDRLRASKLAQQIGFSG
jgi:rSAM/selenodomain-associated transferase 1